MQAESIRFPEPSTAQPDRASLPACADYHDLRFQPSTVKVRALAAVFAVIISAGMLGAVLALYDSAAPAAHVAMAQPPLDRLAIAMTVSRMASSQAPTPGVRSQIPTKPVCSTVRNPCA